MEVRLDAFANNSQNDPHQVTAPDQVQAASATKTGIPWLRCVGRTGLQARRRQLGARSTASRRLLSVIAIATKFNNTLLGELEAKGLVVSGACASAPISARWPSWPGEQHPWFVGCQFHPEFTSSPRNGHPLFTFVRAAIHSGKCGKAVLNETVRA